MKYGEFMSYQHRKLALLLGMLLPSLVLALPEDKDQPIHLEAKSAQFDQNTGISTYTGNVVVTQGTMRLTADVAKIYIQNGAFQRMEASGAPTTFRYQPQADKEVINGEGLRIEYNVATDKVYVIDKAKFTQGGDVFTGDRVEYDLSTDLINASSVEGGRIKITIQPRPNQIRPKKN